MLMTCCHSQSTSADIHQPSRAFHVIGQNVIDCDERSALFIKFYDVMPVDELTAQFKKLMDIVEDKLG